MKTNIISMFIATIFAVPAFAVDSAPQPKAPGPKFEQRKADLLKRIDERIVRIQEEKTCVQAATNHDGIKACREKLKSEMKEQHQQMKK